MAGVPAVVAAAAGLDIFQNTRFRSGLSVGKTIEISPSPKVSLIQSGYWARTAAAVTGVVILPVVASTSSRSWCVAGMPMAAVDRHEIGPRLTEADKRSGANTCSRPVSRSTVATSQVLSRSVWNTTRLPSESHC